jgi:small subunit ribosomal protein S8
MNVNDPIADMLTRIRNGLMAGHQTVSIPNSKVKSAIARILQEEGFLEGVDVVAAEQGVGNVLRLRMKYVGERRDRHAVISGLVRISRPGRRVYVGTSEIPWVRSGMGIAILSTPKGVMTGGRARQLGVGGEVICQIW